MEPSANVPWLRLLKLLIKIVSLLAPLFLDKTNRHRTKRAIESLDALREDDTAEYLPPILCAMLRPSIDEETEVMLKDLHDQIPEELNWKNILDALIAILKLLMDLFAPDDDDNDDDDIDPATDLVDFTAVTARLTVERAQIAHFRTKIAQALRDAADDMTSADCPDCRTAREQCRSAITSLIGPHAEKWRAFSDKLDAAMTYLADKLKLNNLAAYQQAYRDIAEGILEA